MEIVKLPSNQKEKIVVCGPSGSGKSTLIRCINRLEEHQEGNIIVDGNEIIKKEKIISNTMAEKNTISLVPFILVLKSCKFSNFSVS